MSVITRGVQNRTNPKEKPQTEPIQTETAICSDVFGSFFYSTKWFGSVCGFDFTNRTKPNRDIRKTLIKYISSRPILVEIQRKL